MGTGTELNPTDLSRTDLLAGIRTDLANERTLLAYFRTGLALVIAAITARQLLEDPGIRALGAATGVLGGVILAVGAGRFLRTRARVREVTEGRR